MQFTKIQPPNMLQQIIAQIKYNLSTGAIKKGDKLPSERLLCQEFGLSRSTLREALKTLEVLGIVECLHGSGYYIANNIGSSMSEPLGIMMVLENGSFYHTYQLRHALEKESAMLAAEKAGYEDIVAMENLIARIREERDEQVKAALDWRFHFAIAKASGNPLLSTLLSACETLINEHIHGVRALILQQGDNEERINIQHEAVLEAIKRRDVNAAAEAVNEHMEMIEESLKRANIQ